MKKIGLVLIVVLTLSAQCAFAQNMFNHVALGVTAGIDGLGIEAATPLGNSFQLRAGYSFMPFSYSGEVDFGSAKIGNKTRDLDNTPLNVKLWEGGEGKVLADWFPGEGPFHVTAGVYIGGNFIKTDFDLSRSLNADERGSLGIGFEGGSTFTTDVQGIAHVDVNFLPVMPYVGIGFGRAISEERVSVSFDLGALATGGIKPQSYNYIKNTLDPSNPVEVIDITSSAVSNKDDGLIDKISGIPVFPMLKINIFVKLF